MSRSVTITTIGLNKIIKSLNSFPDNLKQEVNMEFAAAADEVKAMAQRNLSSSKTVDEGRLKNAISSGKVGENYEVAVGVTYAPFVEFGTKKRFQATRGFENYAKQFKGKAGGNIGSLDEAILGWVKRKRIKFEKAKSKTGKTRFLTPEQTAFIIARFISFHGTRPHPYLFPAFVKVRRELTKNIIAAIRRAFNK
jgi:HK97 gp10 family phage protein